MVVHNPNVQLCPDKIMAVLFMQGSTKYSKIFNKSIQKARWVRLLRSYFGQVLL